MASRVAHWGTQARRNLVSCATAAAAVAAADQRAYSNRPQSQVERLRQLLEMDPSGARREIQKHVNDVRVVPATEMGDRVVRLTGRVNADGLLGGEEAVRLQLVA